MSNVKEHINGAAEAVSVFGIKTSHYIIAATGLVAALSWNTAIKEGIQHIYQFEKDEIRANFIYAIIMTCILVLLIYLLPDTKSELPSATRRRLEQAQLENQKEELLKEIDQNKKEMLELKKKINEFENKHLYQSTPYYPDAPLETSDISYSFGVV